MSMLVNRTPIKIGTRGSPLALYQAHAVAKTLSSSDIEIGSPESFEIVEIQTSGDKIQDRRLSELGGKALFTKEIERALVSGEIDLAVHSAKDVDTVLSPGTVLACVLPRADRREAFISAKYDSIAALPLGAPVGTVSLRRQSQLLRIRPDLNVVMLRGNVATRLRRVAEGQVDATFLAAAGLKRLGLENEITAILETSIMMPAAGQGAIVVQARADDRDLLPLLARVSNPISAAEVRAERAVLAQLGGSCDTPIAVMAVGAFGGDLTLTAKILRPDGTEEWRASAAGKLADAVRLGNDVGSSLARQCDPNLLIQISGTTTG